jgi:drug/metabolite transporter (DMT)-like permease
MKRRHWQGHAVLIAVTLIWGTTFAVTKSSLDHVPPLYFLAWRFSIAAAVLAALNFRALPSVTWEELLGGLVMGMTLTVGYITQTVGMVYSSAAKAGFITGLAVVLVPLVGAIFFRRRPGFFVYIAAAVAAVGLALLTLDPSEGWSIGLGEIYLLTCAVAFAFNILCLGYFAPRCRVGVLTTLQIAVIAVVCWLATSILETPVPLSGQMWLSLLYLAVVATVITFSGQVWGQRLVSPERAALIYTLEPVFTAFFARLLLGETLPATGVLGSILIMAGIIGAELAPGKGKQREME